MKQFLTVSLLACSIGFAGCGAFTTKTATDVAPGVTIGATYTALGAAYGTVNQLVIAKQLTRPDALAIRAKLNEIAGLVIEADDARKRAAQAPDDATRATITLNANQQIQQATVQLSLVNQQLVVAKGAH